jgi:hypothetical protein
LIVILDQILSPTPSRYIGGIECCWFFNTTQPKRCEKQLWRSLSLILERDNFWWKFILELSTIGFRFNLDVF